MVLDKYFEDFEIGETTVTQPHVVTQEEILAFCDATGCQHPLHRDRERCRQQFGREGLLVSGAHLLSVSDALFAEYVSPTIPFSPHYGYDKVRFVHTLFSDEPFHVEFVVADKLNREGKYGIVFFHTKASLEDGTVLLTIVDRLAVAYHLPNDKGS